jgi:SAM-dependent methyltransferase
MPTPSKEQTESLAQGFYAKKQLYLKDWLISWSHRRRFETGLQLVRQFEPKRLLDYGCGDGTFLALLGQTAPSLEETAGCELLEGLVSGLQDRFRSVPSLRFHLVQQVDNEAYYGHYDLITCMEVLEHVVETREVIDRLSRLLAPGGRLVISVPVEIGAALVVKQAARRLAGWRGLGDYRFVARYSWSELYASLAPGVKQHIPRSVYRDPDGTYFHDHKGFNWKVLQRDLDRVFRTERIVYSPVGWLPAMASQVWLILTRRDAA